MPTSNEQIQYVRTVKRDPLIEEGTRFARSCDVFRCGAQLLLLDYSEVTREGAHGHLEKATVLPIDGGRTPPATGVRMPPVNHYGSGLQHHLLNMPHGCHDLDWLLSWGLDVAEILPQAPALTDYYVWAEAKNGWDFMRQDGQPHKMTYNEAVAKAHRCKGIVVEY